MFYELKLSDKQQINFNGITLNVNQNSHALMLVS